MGFDLIVVVISDKIKCAQLLPDVSWCAHDCNMTSQKNYLELHKHFQFSYFLIGLLEMNLRKQVPLALSKRFEGEETFKWYSGLRLNEQGQKSLNIALQINRDFPENYLPFSFWRYLLSNKNYGPLWLPTLHTIFLAIESPRKINSFRAVDKNMDTALRLRNNVAHFNMDAAKHMYFSQERVKWLLINLGVDASLLIQPGRRV